MRTTIGSIALIATLSALTIAADAQSKQHYVPDSNPATGGANAWPFTTSGTAGPNWRYQFLIPATQMPSTGINITDVAVAPTSTVTFTANQFQMRMAHTSLNSLSTTTCFDNVLGPSAVTVYNGPITFAMTSNTWSPLGLQNNFLYDGQSNLVVEIRYRATSLVSRGIHTASIQRTWTNGWNSNPDPYNSMCPEFFNAGSGPKVCFTYDDVQINATGTPSLGASVTLNLIATPAPGKVYQTASSLGTGPIQVDRRQLNLDADNMLVASVFGVLSGVFQNYTGVLSARGRGTSLVNIPRFNALVGIDIHNAFVVLDTGSPSGIQFISNTDPFKIVP